MYYYTLGTNKLYITSTRGTTQILTSKVSTFNRINAFITLHFHEETPASEIHVFVYLRKPFSRWIFLSIRTQNTLLNMQSLPSIQSILHRNS